MDLVRHLTRLEEKIERKRQIKAKVPSALLAREDIRILMPPGGLLLSGGGGGREGLGGGRQVVALAGGRGPAGLEHGAEEAGADLGGGLVEGEGDVGELGRVADQARVRVPRDVRPPLPRRRVRVARPHVFCLQPLELLLRAQFVRLDGVERWVACVS